jgi:hypothetical protein
VMKYCSKNSDTLRGRGGEVLYEGARVGRD